ncbi:MAG: hypothetical protein ACRDRE_03280 [Pseudonocardiaceae bacterium]
MTSGALATLLIAIGAVVALGGFIYLFVETKRANQPGEHSNKPNTGAIIRLKELEVKGPVGLLVIIIGVVLIIVGSTKLSGSPVATDTGRTPTAPDRTPVAPSTDPGTATIHADDQVSVSRDNIRVSGLGASSEHDPPRVNDRITIKFTLQNAGQRPVALGYTFIGARNPTGTNKDFGEDNNGKVLAPSEKVDIKISMLATEKGVWKFWPCYTIENNFCPNEWRAFQVAIVGP